MTSQPAFDGLGAPVRSQAPIPAGERLTLVPEHAEVHRTYADGERARSSGRLWRRSTRRVPAGLVHAAELDGARSLCGLPLDTLHEFGRSRHPFERFDVSRRCPECHLSTGGTTG
jgi:hypothetical protein